MSNSALHSLAIIPEIVYGTTPTVTPNFKKKAITGTTLGLSKGKLESERINPNRQVSDVRHGNRQVGGDISFELQYAGHDDMFEALLGGTWTGNVLAPGTTRRSFSVLRQFTDMAGGTNPFHLFKGVEFNTLNLSVTPEQIVKGSFGVIGREVAYASAAPAGTTYTEINANRGFDSFTGSLNIDDVAIANITEITLQIENGMEPRFHVFDDRTNQPKIGKCRVSGQMTAYFSDADLLVAFNGAVRKALQFSLVDEVGNAYTFDLPSILGTGGQPDVSGDNDVTITFPFTSIYNQDTPIQDSLQITRSDA